MNSQTFLKAFKMILEGMKQLSQKHNVPLEYLQFKLHTDGTGWIESVSAVPSIYMEFNSIEELEEKINSK